MSMGAVRAGAFLAAGLLLAGCGSSSPAATVTVTAPAVTSADPSASVAGTPEATAASGEHFDDIDALRTRFVDLGGSCDPSIPVDSSPEPSTDGYPQRAGVARCSEDSGLVLFGTDQDAATFASMYEKDASRYNAQRTSTDSRGLPLDVVAHGGNWVILGFDPEAAIAEKMGGVVAHAVPPPSPTPTPASTEAGPPADYISRVYDGNFTFYVTDSICGPHELEGVEVREGNQMLCIVTMAVQNSSGIRQTLDLNQQTAVLTSGKEIHPDLLFTCVAVEARGQQCRGMLIDIPRDSVMHDVKVVYKVKIGTGDLPDDVVLRGDMLSRGQLTPLS